MSGIGAFERLATDYARARPDYPAPMLAALVAFLGDTRTSRPGVVLDVGSGTGISTRALAGDLGHDWLVVAVEPNGEMRRHARALSNSGISVAHVAAIAEALPVRRGSVPLVLVAQAVQWFDRPRFYVEARRVLQSDGVLAVLQNNRQWSSSAFLQEYEAFIERHNPGYSRSYRDFSVAEELRDAGFAEVTSEREEWVRTMGAPEFESFARSSTKVRGAMASLGEDLARAELGRLFQAHSRAGAVEIPYVTELFMGRRTTQ